MSTPARNSPVSASSWSPGTADSLWWTPDPAASPPWISGPNMVSWSIVCCSTYYQLAPTTTHPHHEAGEW